MKDPASATYTNRGTQYIYVADALPGGLFDQTTVRFVDTDGDGDFDGVVRKDTSEVVPVAALNIEAKKLFRAHQEKPFPDQDRFESDHRFWINQRIAAAITQDSHKACGLSFSSYLSLIEEYRESEGVITEPEIDDLYYVADECGPDVTSNDSIQHAFYQLVGPPNPNPNGNVPYISSRIATYFPEGHPVFEEPGYLAEKGENLCMSFDYTGSMMCDGDYDLQKPEIHSVRWKDNGMRDTWREEVMTRHEGNQWRVALEEPNYKMGMDLIRRNLPYKEIVHHGIEMVLESARDPWELTQYAQEIRALLVESCNEITQQAKRFYNSYISNIVSQFIESRVTDPGYQEYFINAERWNYNETMKFTRTDQEIKDGGVDDYHRTGLGMVHQAVTLISGGHTVWVGLPALLALAKGTAAASTVFPPMLIASAAIFSVCLVGVATIRIVEGARASKAYEEQFTKRPNWKPLPDTRNGIRETIMEHYQKEQRHAGLLQNHGEDK